IDAVGIVAHPPLIAIGPVRKCRVAGGRELLRIGASGDVVDDACRHNLAAVELTAVAHDLAEAREVARRRVEPATTTLDAEPVYRIMRLFFSAHRLPDPRREHSRE